MRRLGSTDPYPPDAHPHPDAFCSTFDHTTHAVRCSVITVNKRMYKKGKLYAMGVILHECVHAYQDVLTTMGEKKPGSEFEAYSVQYIFIKVMAEFVKYTR